MQKKKMEIHHCSQCMNYHSVCSNSLRPHRPRLIRTGRQSLIQKRAKGDAGWRLSSAATLLCSFVSCTTPQPAGSSGQLFICLVETFPLLEVCCCRCLLTVSFLTIHEPQKTNIYFSHNHSCSGFFFLVFFFRLGRMKIMTYFQRSFYVIFSL